MKRWIAVGLVTAVAALWWSTQARTEPPPNQVQDFMQVKLQHSQAVLEGLTIEDFDLIAKNAQDISLLSQAAAWQVLQTAEYVQHSSEFRRSADALRDAAKKKNLDGAALHYVDMTLKCINCHKYVRGVRVARYE